MRLPSAPLGPALAETAIRHAAQGPRIAGPHRIGLLLQDAAERRPRIARCERAGGRRVVPGQARRLPLEDQPVDRSQKSKGVGDVLRGMVPQHGPGRTSLPHISGGSLQEARVQGRAQGVAPGRLVQQATDDPLALIRH